MTHPKPGTMAYEVMILWRTGMRDARQIYDNATVKTTLKSVFATISTLRRKGLIEGRATFGRPLVLSAALRDDLTRLAKRHGFATGSDLARRILSCAVRDGKLSQLLDE